MAPAMSMSETSTEEYTKEDARQIRASGGSEGPRQAARRVHRDHRLGPEARQERRRARWSAGWRKSAGKPVFYHVISRVVERRFAFGPEEKEKFRALMRLQEKFTGCRMVSTV